jgi:hypothetical protein
MPPTPTLSQSDALGNVPAVTRQATLKKSYVAIGVLPFAVKLQFERRCLQCANSREYMIEQRPAQRIGSATGTDVVTTAKVSSIIQLLPSARTQSVGWRCCTHGTQSATPQVEMTADVTCTCRAEIETGTRTQEGSVGCLYLYAYPYAISSTSPTAQMRLRTCLPERCASSLVDDIGCLSPYGIRVSDVMIPSCPAPRSTTFEMPAKWASS